MKKSVGFILVLLCLGCSNVEKKEPIAELENNIIRGTLVISPDLKRAGYVSFFSNVDSCCVVVDGKRQKKYSGIRGLTFSPDSKHFAYVAEKGEGKVVVVDSTEMGIAFDRIWIRGFTFDNRVVYSGSQNGKECIVVDDEKGKLYDAVAPVFFSPDRKNFAYGAEGKNPGVNRSAYSSTLSWVVKNDKRIGKKHHGSARSLQPILFSPDGNRIAYTTPGIPTRVVVDETIGKQYKRVNSYDIVFSSDSKKVGYIAKDYHWYYVVVNGKEVAKKGYGRNVPAVLAVKNVVFSPNSERIAYLVEENKNRMYIVVDGKEGKRYKAVSAPLFTPDSEQVVYVACEEDGTIFIVRVKEQEERIKLSTTVEMSAFASENLISSVMFSPDRQRFVFRAAEWKKQFAVIDGKEMKRYDEVSKITFSPDGNQIAYVAKALEKKDDGYTLNEFVVVNEEESQKFFGIQDIMFIDNVTIRYVAWEGSPITTNNKIYYKGNRLYMFEEKIIEGELIAQ